jgi:hypothetical protein
MRVSRVNTRREWWIKQGWYGPMPDHPDSGQWSNEADEQCVECGWVPPLDPLAEWGFGGPAVGVFVEGCGGAWRCGNCHKRWEDDLALLPKAPALVAEP